MPPARQRMNDTQTQIKTLPPPQASSPTAAGSTPAPVTNPSNALNGRDVRTGRASSINRPQMGYLKSDDHRAAFYAYLAKIAYAPAGEGVVDVASYLGIGDEEHIAMADPAPDGWCLTFNRTMTKVYCIAGTHKEVQRQIYQSSGRMAEAHMTLGSDFIKAGTDTTSQEVIPFFAQLWFPFISMVKPWLARIANDMQTDKGAYKVMVCGHSLGGALAQIISMWASMHAEVPLLADVLPVPEGGVNATAAIVHSTVWRNFAGGWSFGSPNFVGGHKNRYLTSESRLGSPVWGENPNRGFPYTSMTGSVTRYEGLDDPIQFVPAPFNGTPWYFFLAGATCEGKPGPRKIGQPWYPRYGRLNGQPGSRAGANYPPNKEAFITAMQDRHPIDYYTNLLTTNLDRISESNQDWVDAWNAVTTLVVAPQIPGFR